MPKPKGQGRRRRSKSTSSSNSIEKTIKDKQLSVRTKKQIDSLPEHAQHIYKKSAC
jgi:hypothetical protein